MRVFIPNTFEFVKSGKKGITIDDSLILEDPQREQLLHSPAKNEKLYDRSQKAVLIKEYQPRDKLFLDFTGDKLFHIDSTGVNVECAVCEQA